MGATISVKELAEAYVAFVNENFMTPEGCGNPAVDAEFIRLEDCGELKQASVNRKNEADRLILAILAGSPESRREQFLQTDSMLLALLYERALLGTQLLKLAADKGVKVPAHQVPLLPEFFRDILLQNLKP